MMSTYELLGVFETGDFSITYPVHEVRAVSDKGVEVIGQLNSCNYGGICYDVKSREVFHVLDYNPNDLTKWIDNELCIAVNTHFKLFNMDQNDYEELPYLDWEKILYAYCKEKGIKQYYFEAVGYDIKKESVSNE